jgi:hypothetical protein
LEESTVPAGMAIIAIDMPPPTAFSIKSSMPTLHCHHTSTVVFLAAVSLCILIVRGVIEAPSNICRRRNEPDMSGRHLVHADSVSIAVTKQLVVSVGGLADHTTRDLYWSSGTS